jgi:oligopeptide/dipeptide ABC transporter ATP-binding protein
LTDSTSPNDKARLLEVNDLKTYFHTREALVKAVDGVSFHVDRGEILGIVGESGSGKSVTAASILRLVDEPAGRIEGGEILLEGRNLLSLSEREMQRVRGRRISMILQDPMASLDPVFTVESQLAETMRAHGVTAQEGQRLHERVMDLLRMVQIPAPEARARAYPHQLSGGLRQRVVAAIAISCESSLLIADEPTTALDVTIQRQFLDMLCDLQRRTNMGMILITHDLGIVANTCDRVVVMYAGRIVETADVHTLFARPSHPYTKALLDSVPRLNERRRRLTAIAGQPPDAAHTPPGCPFHPRCPSRLEICDQEYPPLVAVGEPSHTAACWLHEVSE